jgi:hypothetical protein
MCLVMCRVWNTLGCFKAVLQAEDGGHVASHHHAAGPGDRQADHVCPGVRLEVFRHETVHLNRAVYTSCMPML